LGALIENIFCKEIFFEEIFCREIRGAMLVLGNVNFDWFLTMCLKNMVIEILDFSYIVG